ncbi:MAG: PE-PPE domain-containing protein [Mycobacterium sp.]|nr:PE-PPE domain-containing protein [Mycobacterium sp.]
MSVRQITGTLLAAALTVTLPVPVAAGGTPTTTGPASSTDVRLAATVLTLEGGIVGLQHLLHFTPLQLQGALCDAPNVCDPVDYFAMPLGQYFNDLGAVKVNEAISALPDDGSPITLFGHSQGGQVIYSALRGWAADPAGAPDPSRISWVSIGNPENTFGGRDPDPIPADSPYQGIEVIRQYDGWADWPTDQRNLLAVLNAIVGMNTTHVTGYFNVDINGPDNLRYTEGNVTYVFVPNPMLPLVQSTGLLAPLLNPVLDPILRPIVEAGYQRPGGLGAVNAPAPGATTATTATAAATIAADRDAAPVAPTRARVRSAAAVSSAAASAATQPEKAAVPEATPASDAVARSDTPRERSAAGSPRAGRHRS